MVKWLLIALLLLLLAGVGALYLNIGSAGESRVEEWVGSQLKTIVNQHDRYKLEFDSIDYRAPNRVILKDLRLSLADSTATAAPLIEVAAGTVELAKVPRWGEPIVIRSVSLDSPVVHVESFIAAARTGRSNPATTRPALSSILTLERVEIANGTVTYDDGKGSPLSWSSLDAKLNLETIDQRWHRARIAIDESPLMEADIGAEINLDEMVLRNIDAKAFLDLNDPAATKFFTPGLQRLIEKFQVRGHTDVHASGLIDFKRRDQTKFDAALQMSDAHVLIGQYHLPIRSVDAIARVRGTRVIVKQADVMLLGGEMHANARIDLDGERAVTGQLIASKLRLDELLDARLRSEPTSLLGLVDADIRAQTNLADLRAVSQNHSDGLIWGSGYVNVREARLVRIPVIAQLMSITNTVTDFFNGKGSNRDSFEAQFKLIDKIFDISDMVYRGQGVGMRGKGRIAVNGEVDLVVNAGPLERLQQSLGPLGRVWGRVSDKLMSYSVKGTLKEPSVRPMLGGG